MLVMTTVALLFIGMVTMRFALKGRPIDQTPLCAACGFDLSGRPTESERCSECGAGLHTPVAIRIGHRRAHRGMIVLAGAILLAAAASGGMAFLAIQQIDLQSNLPTAWLAYEADHSTSPSAVANLKILADRWRRGDLSAAQRKALVEKALNNQADMSQPFLVEWADRSSWPIGPGS